MPQNENMTRLFFALLAFGTVLVSCNDYGRKIEVNDTVDVYIKGDSVNEEDARRLGEYITEYAGYSKNEKSLQLSKRKGTYVVKMVVGQEKLKNGSVSEENFANLKSLLQREVFKNQPVKLTITDNNFVELKSF